MDSLSLSLSWPPPSHLSRVSFFWAKEEYSPVVRLLIFQPCLFSFVPHAPQCSLPSVRMHAVLVSVYLVGCMTTFFFFFMCVLQVKVIDSVRRHLSCFASRPRLLFVAAVLFDVFLRPSHPLSIPSCYSFLLHIWYLFARPSHSPP